jgi:pimeloyl-ACP methyl ester carboxylesterase
MTSMEPIPFRPPVDFTRGDVDAGGVRLNYWRHGQGRPLLVLHGVTSWGLSWARFARRVGGQFDCVLLDQRGHGYSDKPGGNYGAAEAAADARNVVERLALGRPAVLGHSMGGGIALGLAATYPEAVDRLVLVDPALRLRRSDDVIDDAGIDPRPSWQERRAQLKRRQVQGRRALLAEALAANPSADREYVAYQVEGRLLASPEVFAESRRFDPQMQEAQLRALRCPALIVRGEPERGGIIPDDTARRIAELAPDGRARVVTVAGTGHSPQVDAFELFVAVVLPFLAGEAAPSPEGGSPACLLHLVDDGGSLREPPS